MSRFSGRTIGLGVGALLVAVVAVVAQLTAPSGAMPSPEIVPVVTSELICPDAKTTVDLTTTTQIYAVTPSNLAAGPSGGATIGTLVSPTALGSLAGSARALAATTGPKSIAVVGNAVGGRAPGFAMDQWMTSESRTRHGLSGATCGEPANDMWFVGTASAVGRTSTLYLTDTEATPATVDIALYGTNGRIEAPAGQGLVVKANSRRVVHLDQLAPGAGWLAVHVTASSGRVGAGVFDNQVNGLQPLGSDWLPISDPPAKTVVVPGVVAGEGSRTLTVFAPGEGTATVRVRLIGQQGSFAPTGAANFEIDRGKVSTVVLSGAAATDNSSAVIDSDVPLVAGLRFVSTAGAIDDVAFTAGVSALTSPAVLAGVRNAPDYDTSLLLTATGAAASVSVQPVVTGVPKGPPVIVSIAANHSVRVHLPIVTTGPFAALITPRPGSGPVHGAMVRNRWVDGSPGITISTIRSSRITVAVPEAAPDLDVGLGR